MIRFVTLAVCVSLFCLAGAARAEDINPPSWRGDEGSTYQQWEFLADDTTPPPDYLDNPYGQPALTVYPTHPYWDIWGGMDGVWQLSGLIDVEIPNNPVENDYKLLQIQLTWAASFPFPIEPFVVLEAEDISGQPLSSIDLLSETDVILGPTGETGAGEFWHHKTYLYSIIPNPAIEAVYISGSIMVDELVIDTICIPEPATLGVLLAGAVLVLTRKTRRHRGV